MPAHYSRSRSQEQEPLLPQHRNHIAPDAITGHQKSLDKKLHSYLLVRALARGYLPSSQQAITLLRKLLASAVLVPDNKHLTYDGRKLVVLNRRLVKQLIELLQTKNPGDEFQDFLWTLREAHLHVDLQGLGHAATDMKTVNARAAYNSFSTLGSLLLQNPDFNKLLADGLTACRQALASGVSTAAEYAEHVADEIEPPDTRLDAIGDEPDTDQPRVDEEARETVKQVEATIEEGIKEAAKDAKETLIDTATPERKAAMKERVRQAVTKLRRNADYGTSVATMTLLLKSYLTAYSTAVEDAAEEIADDVKPNKALVSAGNLFWKFVTTFGERKEWDVLQTRLKKLLKHKDSDPEFENVVSLAVDSLRRVMTDPEYLFTEEDEAQERFMELTEKMGSEKGGDLKHDVEALIEQMERVAFSVYGDRQISNIKDTSFAIADLALTSSESHGFNTNLLSDVLNVLIPLALETIQYIPIPRLTIVSPHVDVLLEPIIFEPGKTVNSSSFLPYRVAIVTVNEVDVFKDWRRTKTQVSSTARVKIEGITFKAEDVGYIMNVHRNWLVNFTDSGIATVSMDQKGIDVYLDLEFTKSSVDELVILRGVSVNLHKLDFTLQRSKFSFLAWLFKPLVKPMLRKLLQTSIQQAIEEGLRGLNREMIYTRERLRAARIANPRDLTTFVRAVLARWTDPSDLPIEVGVDWRAHRANGRAEAPFDGEYAPGSLVGLFEAEAMGAGERVEEGDTGGWRNACFAI
ncbi:hypothetical protein DRE_04578 [Drechslerella stenobrocha 248]|uniref:Bactericidal permeability-increasing protein n=1 Tax=Drechslerella stenobrocha 248 TaxID=1043628 RepID=W7IAT7_9PEZI|nr:hypothetical protein DRE_04578 [Drechslerella stenobrocha 248]